MSWDVAQIPSPEGHCSAEWSLRVTAEVTKEELFPKAMSSQPLSARSWPPCTMLL